MDEREDGESNNTEQEWGSDFVADFLCEYGFDFLSFNPGASFRGIEESVVNYRDNTPEVIETPHESLSVSIAHGYAKATGEPAVCALHDVVGTMHGTLSIFSAWCDRVPVLILAGAGPMRKSKRRPWIDWVHTAQIQGNLVRGFTKWDDQPAHVDGVSDSLLRGVKIANTSPKGPTYIPIDSEIQEAALSESIELPDFSQYDPPSKIAPSSKHLDKVTEELANATMPAIVVDLVGRSPESVEHLIDLAEQLCAPVIDFRRRRYNFPNTHPLNATETDILDVADVILALDVASLAYGISATSADKSVEEITNQATIIEIGLQELHSSSLLTNSYSLQKCDHSILADVELAVPELVSRLSEKFDKADDTMQQRKELIFEERKNLEEYWQKQLEENWDNSPIALSRLAHELWNVVKDNDWALVHESLRGWIHRLWEIDEYDAFVGDVYEGGGMGCGIGAAIGAGFAYRDSDRVPINIQPDGDLLYHPGALWILGHYELPMLTVVHNNQSYYNSTEHRMNLAKYRGRDASYERALIGTGIWDPVPDYATYAESMGVTGFGPVEDPDRLDEVLSNAWSEVQSGKPVLVDVICQPR